MTNIRRFKNVARIMILLTILSGIVATQTACPSGGPKEIRKTAEAVKDIGGGTRDVIKAVHQAWEKGLITLEQKDRWAKWLGQIARGGQAGVVVLDAINKTGVTELPADEAAALNKLFSDQVVAPFLGLITDIAKLSDAQSAAIRAAIAGLRTTILLLSSRIGRNDVIEKINAAPWKPVLAINATWRFAHV